MNKKIYSISDFVNEIFRISKRNKNESNDIFFRGESKDYGETSCIPGIFRVPNWIKNEHKLFYDTIRHNPDLLINKRLTIEKLTIMQHYGLPTRLLDLTSNALAALYMAISKYNSDSNRIKNDAIVYVLTIPNGIIKYFDSDSVSVIANLVKREKFDFPIKYEKNKKKFNEQKDIKYLLHSIKDEKPYFKDEIVPEHLYSIRCVLPTKNNSRILLQQGSFLLFGNDKNDKFKPAKLSDSEIKREKIIIDKNSIKEIIKKLEYVGISMLNMFPDIQSVSEYLKNKYK